MSQRIAFLTILAALAGALAGASLVAGGPAVPRAAAPADGTDLSAAPAVAAAPGVGDSSVPPAAAAIGGLPVGAGVRDESIDSLGNLGTGS